MPKMPFAELYDMLEHYDCYAVTLQARDLPAYHSEIVDQ